MSRSLRRPPATPRRPRVPPVLTRGTERFEGLAILDELTDDLGLVLWRSLRNVLTWARTPAGQRAGLFAGAAAPIRQGDLAHLSLDPELHAPLSVIVALLEAPEKADISRLSNACRRVALWAEDRGSLATALDYAQAAAAVAPDVALLSYHVGRVARRLADYDRAEGWFLRAIIQGRQQKDWRAYALAFSGMGNLFVQKGNFPEARRFHQRCLRAAVRYSLRDLEGDAAHDLFVVSVETGAYSEAEEFAHRAFTTYSAADQPVIRLAKDVAYFWNLKGLYRQALELSSALLPHYPAPGHRAFILADMARAAGGVGDRVLFQKVWDEVWDMDESGTADDAMGPVLLDLAYGATSLGDWSDAESAAQRALTISTRRKEGRVCIMAERVLAAIQTRTREVPSRASVETSSADVLMAQMVKSLSGHHGLAVV